ncbi:MAG TPA: guanylate kinase [Verrucomicrobiales bacterium]|jgi:guanylate kinase|nr:guanylate kinase [Verrucomicrobiales bacterium]HCI92351.1 guanylate kinase [Verrucomicrobiales bacterium]
MESNTCTRTGILLVVSGPSGSGKTTLCRRIADEGEAIYSTSCTTRPPRNGEQNGHDYHFLTREEFTQRVKAGEFLEYAEVHNNFYGTLKNDVLEHLAAGVDVVMDIDVQGAELVRACADTSIQAAIADLFIMPPNEKELLHRLTGRGTDSDEVIALRMKNALEEMAHWPKYSYRIISLTREEDYSKFKSLLAAERMRVTRILTS